MILQALYEYYQRKDPDEIPPVGWEQRGFKYSVVLNSTGSFVSFRSLVETDDLGRDKPKSFFVPSLGEKKGNGIKANLLWENPEYLLGIPTPTQGKPNPDLQRVELQHKVFREKLRSLSGVCEHPVLNVIELFLANIDRERIMQDPLWSQIQRESPFLILCVEGLPYPVDIPEIRVGIESLESNGTIGICAVSGQNTEIADLEPAIKGVWGTDAKAERGLVSFNKDSFRSFGKEQNKNAPIGKSVVSAYVAALNLLLSPDSPNRLQLGGASTVFWAQKAAARIEPRVKSFFALPPKEKDDTDKGATDAKQTLLSILNGITPEESEAGFYILGLSPNSARISVRFWHQGTVGEFARHMRQHLEDLTIVAPKQDQERVGLMYLLCSLVLGGKIENIPPNLEGNVMHAILTDSPYPETLQQQCLRRIRAEQSIPRVRAAILKACINRKLRRSNPNNEEEITVSLDTTNTHPGYRLGRLFAVLEKIQEDASGGKLNSTIRDRFYGSASANPGTVFPRLINLAHHHLSKLKADRPSWAVSDDKWLREIFGEIDYSFPPHMSMDDQGRFAIGYYHQRQAFYASKAEIRSDSEGDQK